ncbi:MAG TPA: hypothetical protein ENH84_04460 [Phycisphaerae bacterium]|nr:hypothetical protein [Phycisphaerae bacterium]
MTHRRWIGITLVAGVICAMITLALFHNDIAIAYHHRAMMRAWAKIRKVGPNNSDQSQWIESYERHRDALVQYGYLARREFPLVVKPPETRRVWKQVTAEFPDYIHVAMQTTQWGGTVNKIIVYDQPDRMPAWEAVIHRYDVPEFPTSAGTNTPDEDRANGR